METKKTLLIAGATGYIGKPLTLFLVEQGYHVKVLTRNPQAAKELFPEKVTILPWPKEKEVVKHAVSYSCDVVINLVGENIGKIPWNNKNKQRLIESRTHSVEMLYRLIKMQGEPHPKLWIQASAIGFYGSNTLYPTDESVPMGSGFLAQLVTEWEHTLQNYTDLPVRKVFLRLGIVLSFQGGFLMQMKRMANMGLAICPGNGSQMVSWIHLDDLIRLVAWLLKNDTIEGPVNVVSPNPISMWHFTKTLQRYSRALTSIKIPSFLFKFIFGKEKSDELLLAHQIIIPAKLTNHQFLFDYTDLDQVFGKKD